MRHCPFNRGNPSASQHSPRSPDRCPRRRRAAAATKAVCGALVAVSALSSTISPANASPLPAPFLDFLYPSLFASRSSPKEAQAPTTAASSSTSSSKRSLPPKRKSKKSISSIRKRDLSSGLAVPVKFEPADIGWVLADKWDLHGRHRRTDLSDFEVNPGLDYIQTLDITDPFGGSIIETSGLELPQGWDQSHSVRQDNYDPVIVSVFAVFLVLSILATIGLCRWRARKLRKLRDLEHLTQKEKGELGSDDETIDSRGGNEVKGDAKSSKKTKKGRFSSARSSALRKVNDRLTSRLRKKYRSKASTVEISSTPADNTSREPDSSNPDQEPASVEQTSNENFGDSDRAARQSLTIIPTSDLAVDEPPRSPTRLSSSRSTPRTRPHDSTNPDTRPDVPLPTSSPPAYPIMDLSHSNDRQPEKAPIRGLEPEYDERDLAAYRSRISRRPSHHSERTAELTLDAEIPEVVPPFDTPRIAGSSRIAAGATRQAHVATDDKHVLERLRTMADEPSLPPMVGTSATALDPSSQAAVVPEWTELDEWETQRQLERHLTVDNTREVDTSVNADRHRRQGDSILSLPPPLFTYATSAMVADPSSNYTLGPLWSGMTGASPSLSPLPDQASSCRTPSAPPLDLPPTLVPSAPPQLDEESIPSAPPAWDDEESQASAPPLASPTQPNDNDDNVQHELLQTQGTTTPMEESNNDSDGAESILSHGDRNSRWSPSLRTSTREGRGLPRYEP